MTAPDEKSFLSLLADHPVEGVKGIIGLGGEEAPLSLEPEATGTNPHYPDDLRRAERDPGVEAEARPGSDEMGRPAPGKWEMGVALSGGGIRSATLSLGVFQGLAKQKLLERVGYLSTVSGGGYFGSFLGRLFTRPDLQALVARRGDAKPEAGEGSGVIDPRAQRATVQRILEDNRSGPLRFLRENGRYLAPRGAPDLAVAGAVALRNWVAVLFVMATFAIFAFGLLALLRYGVSEWSPLQGTLFAELTQSPIRLHHVWVSPYLFLGVVLFLLLGLPFGWAYWLARDSRRSDSAWQSFWSWFFRWIPTLALALAFFWIRMGGSLPYLEGVRSPLQGVGFIALLATVAYLALRTWAIKGTSREADHIEFATPQSRVAHLRRLLSLNLARTLMVVAAVVLVGVVDSAGLSLLLLGHRVKVGTLGPYAVVAVSLPVLRLFVSRLLERTSTGRLPGLVSSLLIHALAGVLLLLALAPTAMVSHLVVWRSDIARVSAEALTLSPYQPLLPDSWFAPLMALVVGAGALSFFMGQVWPFVNRSSLHAMYEARLRRAYMGASNPARYGEGSERPQETQTHRDDGASPRSYDPQKCGGPVHLINVTVNQTIAGRSQIERRDRKGLPMAVGPGGISVGRGYHATWTEDEPGKERRQADRFQIFYRRCTPEELDIGQWIAISGAAFSTGLGSRTSVGLSLLAGLLNIRLGYWWHSDLSPSKRPGRTRRTLPRRIGSMIRIPFPAQMALLDEWLARFPGVDSESWYLTDGGHFENLAAYELIRRRLKYIIVCDNEQDPKYTFSGLANLVRKARTDFGASIDFLDQKTLEETFQGTGFERWLCSLERLQRGRWVEEPVRDPATEKKRLLNLGAEEQRFSLGHAAVARITYAGPREDGQGSDGYLLYIKPTLVGDEPVDVLQYHTEHPDFPHQTTTDQFFDEEQWESYRRLGEQISDKLFGNGLLGWVPGK